MFKFHQGIVLKFSILPKKISTISTSLNAEKRFSYACKSCKGNGLCNCLECNGLTRIYEGEKEYKCDSCQFGVIKCTQCGGSGLPHSIFSL
jgi:hypothetical protein